MIIKYVIYNGEDFGMLPNALDMHLTLKEYEDKGYSQIELDIPLGWKLIPWKKDGICSLIVEDKTHYFLFLDFVVLSILSDKVILTSKQYVDFQPIIKLGNQMSN